MCGIAGWYDRQLDLRDVGDIPGKMSESLKRRGPDSAGEYREENVVLLHRRLAVIDIENGGQPMTRSLGNKKCTIVYNGELYNTSELRRELTERGIVFSTHSDTEVVLYSYLYWGEYCISRLNGIFAFAVWDHREKELFLARDRIGVKPLFFYRYDNGLIFASEIKALLKNPLVPRKVNEEGLMELFLIGPGRTPGQGIIEGIEELLPGEYGVYDNGRFVRKRYFELHAHDYGMDAKESVIQIRDLLQNSIERQLVSDVPLFTFLSGGLDSSIISYVASEYNKRTGKPPIDTYSVDYEDNDKYFTKSKFQPTPDSEFIGLISGAIQSNHHYVTINNYDLFKALTDAVEARGLPGMTDVDSSLLLFCKKIKENFTVGLSGECADELFGGYPWYHDADILFEDSFPWSRSLDVRRSVLRKGFLPRGEEYVYQKYFDTCRHTEKLRSDTRLDARMREMFSLNFYWFMQTLLDRKDRMSMYSGLEVRVPFCDYRIVDFAFNMPWKIKSFGGREKGILREAFRGLLPDSIIDRKKSPYPKTHNPIYFELCANRVKEIMTDTTSPISDIIDRQGIQSIIDHPENIASPWYGQLMRAPQILAYIIQVDHWFRKFSISIE